MASTGSGGSVFGMSPDPGQARTVGELIAALRALKVCSGHPSISTITRRIHQAWTAAGRPVGELPGRSTVGFGHTHHALDDPGKAHEHWWQALLMYDELGVPEADDVRIHLDVRTPRS